MAVKPKKKSTLKLKAAEPDPVGEEDVYARLGLSTDIQNAPEAEETRWVSANIVIPVHLIDPKTVPSRAAVGQLQWAKTVGKSEFWKACWAKLLPSKGEVESQARLAKTAGELEGLISRVQDIGLHGPPEPETRTEPAELQRTIGGNGDGD